MKGFFNRMDRSLGRNRYEKSKASSFKIRRNYSRFGRSLHRSHHFIGFFKSPQFFIGCCIIVIAVLFAAFGPTLLHMMRMQPAQETANRYEEKPNSAVTAEKKGPVIKDLSSGRQKIQLKEERINQPAIWGREMLFSAGNGPIDQPVLKSLYLYNLDTKQEEKIMDSKVKFGEIYETQLNEDWFIWLDTDQSGTNIIMAMNRKSKEVAKVKECKNGKPKLRLYGNALIWMEQTGEQEDKLYMFDLVSGENMPVAAFENAASYGVSAPAIYENQIFWAGPDKSQNTIEGTEEKSIINILDVNTLANDGVPEVYKPGTYVHEPMGNSKAILWLDGNKSPESRLLLTLDKKTIKEVAQGVAGYGLGDNFVVYGKNQRIWVYFWDTDEYGLLTAENEKGMLPSVQGKTVCWYDITDSESTKDLMEYKVLE